MPALANPRWERFAQCIVIGLLNGERKSYSQGRAYIAAGYEAKDAGKRGGSAEAAASRLNPSLSALKNFNSKPLNIFKKTQPKSLQNSIKFFKTQDTIEPMPQPFPRS
jgi:hypothetical protein